MDKKVLIALAILLVASLLAGCSAPPQPLTTQPTPTLLPTLSPDAKKIVIGVISSNPSSAYHLYQPLADYLAVRLRIHNIESGEVKVAPDIETMAEWIETGEVQIVFDNIYATMRLRDIGKAKPILRQWKDADARISSVIFANKDSDIITLADLQGKIIILENSHSATGYLLPVSILLENGFKVQQVKSLQSPVPANTIGYYFSGDDENTVQMVLSGKASAGAIGSLFFYDHLPTIARDTLNIIEESDKITHQIVVVSPVLDDKVVASIQAILRSMESDPEGQTLAKSLNNTTHFDNIDASIIFDPARHYYFLITTSQ